MQRIFATPTKMAVLGATVLLDGPADQVFATALEAARKKSYALMLVDVEMPGIDGFTFVEQVRGDPALHDTPVILVTSRNAPEDIRRGEEVRANAYVVKSEFNQTKLLGMIRQMVARYV